MQYGNKITFECLWWLVILCLDLCTLACGGFIVKVWSKMVSSSSVPLL